MQGASQSGVTAFVALSIALFTPVTVLQAAQRYNRPTGISSLVLAS